MNMKEVKDLIQEILQSDISEFELEHTGTKLKLRRGAPQAHASSASMPVAPYAPPPPVAPMVLEHTTSPAAVAAEESDEEALHLITSPIVGTFYRSPSPGAEAYVKIGQMVDEGTTLCIVEAMKLMNEIPSDVAGEVTRIYVENGSPVEFGQKLFGIRARR
jgi:acetyl-CoA carboxylase biotin carboxyl carrier protein